MKRSMVEEKDGARDKFRAAQGIDPENLSGDVREAGGNDSDAEKEPLVVMETATVPQEEYDQLKAERDLLFDRLARLQAEFDNARKREAKERGEFRDYAVSNTVEQFLPVLDNFQLALKSTGIGGAAADGRGADRQSRWKRRCAR